MHIKMPKNEPTTEENMGEMGMNFLMSTEKTDIFEEGASEEYLNDEESMKEELSRKKIDKLNRSELLAIIYELQKRKSESTA